MKTDPLQQVLPGFEQEQSDWNKRYLAQIGKDREIKNRSGIAIQPLYTPEDRNDSNYLEDLGFPGKPPYTRGIYPTMHRGRRWSQRQLIGLGTPEDYNLRVKSLLGAGGNAISLIPCNSVFRGIDCDEVSAPLLGTCGTVINTAGHMADCLDGVSLSDVSTALNDPSPFTLLAFLLVAAERQGVPWTQITGTSNQSDYISHFVANHMFYRLSLPGSRRVLLDHVEYCQQQVPNWNPVSVVGQHMQQAGATPAQAMAFTLCTAIQFIEDCIGHGMDAQTVLQRFTFFFDISISFFEEVAKFRAGRRIWAGIVKQRFGVEDPRAMRFKFHAQTSGADLTRQQPLNNIARVTTQALAGIFGGLQSMHTDGYDEAITCPTVESARIAIATQNILREEAHLCDVIDPLGGSYYVETLTDQMEAEVTGLMSRVEQAGGMYRAVESGMIQGMIGESALAFQNKIDSGEQKIVGVNCHQEDLASKEPPSYRPDPDAIDRLVADFHTYKKTRNNARVRSALDGLAGTAASEKGNTFAAVVESARAGATHGEIVACLRKELGFGQPLITP
jgi:methylmalonyl-CoA mutase N-terminal domain/subunit